jgi:uncharacterized protein (TIGR02569 family)
MSVMIHRPPDAVLQAWDVDDVVPLAGGQGQAFRAGDVVLKPVSEPSRAAWLAEVLDSLAPDPEVRIVRPVATVEGDWVAHGWAGWGWIEGDEWSGSVQGLLDVSAALHRVLKTVGWSPMMIGHDRWAVADRIAWGEQDGAIPPELEQLASARGPLPLRSQLIHGDVRGNVLSSPTEPPAVIDVSPFWRPAAAADAILVVDQLLSGSTDEELAIDALGPYAHQLLIRAVLFRALSEPTPADMAPYVRLADVLLSSVPAPAAAEAAQHVERAVDAAGPRGRWRNRGRRRS